MEAPYKGALYKHSKKVLNNASSSWNKCLLIKIQTLTNLFDEKQNKRENPAKSFAVSYDRCGYESPMTLWRTKPQPLKNRLKEKM